MSRATSLLALLFLGIVVVLVFLPRERHPVDDATIARSITLYGYAEDGSPLWEIRARDGRIDGSDQTLSGVAIDFYGEDLSTLSIRGDRLKRTESVSRLSGNVRIERTDDLLLEAEALTWDEAAERLESGPIDLSTADLHVSAAGFGYDLETETASFTGGVEAVASLEAEWTIRADRAEERDGVVVFHESVVAESEDGESFVCDRLEVDSETETVHLSGEVIGDWSSGHLSAESLRLDGNGMRAAGRVTARLDLEELRKADDT
jgi:lipopolysaccharide export system protein LptA